MEEELLLELRMILGKRSGEMNVEMERHKLPERMLICRVRFDFPKGLPSSLSDPDD